jgi:hypothetical protein
VSLLIRVTARERVVTSLGLLLDLEGREEKDMMAGVGVKKMSNG